jgi:molecular chaperone DnaK
MMKSFVGIDLGTTNSAICGYDGVDVHIYKSPEQNDVTPSAIFIGPRSVKYVGKRAYDAAPLSPDRTAVLFKRLMGTSTPLKLIDAGVTMTPEECSAEILKVLYGYLPEEIRSNPSTGTVITVPAAFSQLGKDATMEAADMAGLGRVALMQEPVAAVMSVMRSNSADGCFLIFDLGGGTLDIAVAESTSGRVSLLSHGGIAVCGGRDFDRALVDDIVFSWLHDNFNLKADFFRLPEYRTLARLCAWAAERAKIELSARDGALISLTEAEVRVKDLDGHDVYVEIPLNRADYNRLIEPRVVESAEAAKEVIAKAGLSPMDLDRVVFVGGPTCYKPLRDLVASELGLKVDTNVNPMTAVAEGASIFAESIDWTSTSHSRKDTRSQIATAGKLGLTFNYISRTPDSKAKIAVNMTGAAETVYMGIDQTRGYIGSADIDNLYLRAKMFLLKPFF